MELHPDSELLCLGFETSCDETAVAVVQGNGRVLSSVVRSQVAHHAPFGGVVPEVASRAHTEMLPAVLDAALDEAGVKLGQIGLVAATYGPGLIGSLLVGVAEAKGIAFARGVPFVAVHHMEGHLFALLLDQAGCEPPAIVLLVSGGHTMIVAMHGLGSYKVLGQTIDDAAGEAFDKIARFIGLGYPGGPAIDAAARHGDREAVKLPRAMRGEGFDVSFSGLKTAVVQHVRKADSRGDRLRTEDIAASFQEAVVDVLVAKTLAAARLEGASRVAMGGGVAANSRLRARLREACKAEGLECHVPSPAFCTDNGAMIAVPALTFG
jgi:N6-L-threonylcarbamoyladenine synthase